MVKTITQMNEEFMKKVTFIKITITTFMLSSLSVMAQSKSDYTALISKRLPETLRLLKETPAFSNNQNTGRSCRDEIIKSETHQDNLAIGNTITKIKVSALWSGDDIVNDVFVEVYYGTNQKPQARLVCEGSSFQAFNNLKD
jgi:midasin (ATPase involved in ribosome maturation)